MATFPTPVNKFVGFLRERNLTNEQNLLLQLAPLTFDEIKTILGYTPQAPASSGVAIPYFNTDGSLLEVNGVPFIRIRRDDWVGEGKYLQSKKSGAHAYLPQIEGLDWKAIALDVKAPICITEGEFKAISGSINKLPTVGLGGVSAICKKGTHDLVDPLDQFILNGRTVYLAFDCDAESTPQTPHKPRVEEAIHRSASILYSQGARPFILYIARTNKWSKGVKIGLDDYFNLGGTWEELLKTAEEPIHDADLAVLNTSYCIYTAGPYVTRISDGHIFRPSQFRELEQNRRRKTERGTKPVADDFLQQRIRPEYDREVFDPRLDWGYHPDRRVFNRWRGYEVEAAPDEEVAANWQLFLQRLCGEHKNFIEQWLAHIIQKPWERTNIALMCVSPVQGIGKSLMGAVMRSIMGRNHSISTNLERMTQQFNNQMEGKILVVVEEAEGLFKNLEGFVKDFITNTTLTVEHKGINAYTVDNYARVMLNSNNPLPLRVTEFDRRWMVWMPPITQDEARGAYGRWINEWSRVFLSPTGLAAIRYSLESVDLESFDPMGRAPITSEFLDMAEGSIKSNDLEAEALYAGMEALGGRMITTAEMTRQYKKAIASLSALVKARGGGKAQMVWKQDGVTRKGSFWWTLGNEPQTRKDSSYNIVLAESIDKDVRDQLILGSARLFGGRKFD